MAEERDDAWYAKQIRHLGVNLSAWFALECAWRTATALEDDGAQEALGDVQQFLLGRLTWFDLDAIQKDVDRRIWATSRTKLLRRIMLRCVRCATFPENGVLHTAAAEAARRLDDRSIQPLTPGVTECERQEQRLDDYSALAERDAIQQLSIEFRKSHDLQLLGMLADTMQDEGYSLPIDSTEQ